MTIKKRRKVLDRRKGTLVLDGLPFRLESAGYNFGLPAKCYMAAYRIGADMVSHGVADDCVWICHGSVLCRSEASPWCGRRIMHGWVEWKINGGWLVADGSRPGHPVWLGTRDQYYAGADTCEANAWRYRMSEAVALVARLEHYGPFRKPKVASDDWTIVDEAKLDADGYYVDE